MRKIEKIFSNIFPVILAVILFFNSTMPGIWAIGDVLNVEGEEQTEEIEFFENEEEFEEILTEEIVVEEEVVEEEEILTEGIVIEEEPVEKIVIEEEIVETWIVNGRTAITTLPVVLGETYVSPQNNDVTITFTKLPTNPSTLSIVEFALNSEEISAINAVFNLAYDITTDMEDGTFEYDLTLPLVSEDFQVVYAENRSELVKEVHELDSYVDNDIVRIEGLNHFTTFVISTYSDATLTVTKGTFAQGETVYVKGTSSKLEKLKLIVQDVNGNNLKECEKDNVKEITCDYLLLPNAPLGVWKAILLQENKDKVWITEATTNFNVIAPAPEPPTLACIADTAGANDEPGQKDLTKFCKDTSTNNPLQIDWNWDEIKMTGANTADACSLFDTNLNGLADYSLCVTWKEDQKQISGSPILYRCNDSRPDRCGGAEAVSISNGSDCSVNPATDDPFSTGTEYPKDTKASCTINLQDVGGVTKADLLDVCSYPSTQPNSDPSDCIIIRTDKGNLTIIKDVTPDDSTTNWNFAVNGPTSFITSISGDGTSGINSIDLGTYTITETAGLNTSLLNYQTNWSCTKNGTSYSSGTGSITSALVIGKVGNVEDSVVCTFTNSLNIGTIIVHKEVIGPHGEDIVDTDTFGVQLDSNPALTQSIGNDGTVIFNNVIAGSHTITEPGLPLGHTIFSITPDSDENLSNGAQFTLAVGETKNIYVINTKNIASIYGHKYNDIDGNGLYDSGIDTPLSGWTIFLDANSNGVLDTAETRMDTNVRGEYSFLGVTAGLNKVCEVSQTGWVRSYPTDCHQITVGTYQAVEDVDFLNYVAPTLTLVKTVTNDNGGTKLVSDFPLFIGLTSAISGTAYSLLAGVTYTASETNVSGYTPSVWGENCNADGTITLAPGDNKTCIINNNDQPGTLIVKKIVVNDNGGTLGASDFSFSINDGDLIPFETDEQNDILVNSGEYSVLEQNVHGYATQYDNCDKLSIGNGETVICTITNDDIQPKLTVTKSVVGGIKSVDAFSLFVDLTSVTSGQSNEFNAGLYTVNETPDSDYTSVITGDCAFDGSVTLDIGEEKTCTITNTRKQGNITFVKNVNVGDALPESWIFSVYQGSDLVGTYNHLAIATLDTGSYTVVENGLGSYFLDSIGGTACSGSIFSGIANLIVSENGGTCIFGNSAKATITINKIVNPANADTFNFAVTTNPAGYLGTTTLGDGESHTFFDLMPGLYNILETSNSDYTVNIMCNDVPGGLNSNVFMKTLSAGENLLCTFTNTQKGKIIVEKQVLPNGHTQTFLFSGEINGTIADDQQLSQIVIPGTYTVSESPFSTSGFRLTDITCDDRNSTGDIATGTTTFNVEAGETVKCTFTNEIFGSITAHKYHDLDQDGTQDINEPNLNGWGMSIYNGLNCLDNNLYRNATTDTLGNTTFYSIIPGQYSIKETLKTGWSNVTNLCQNFTVTPGESEHIDFGNIELGSILVHKFEDVNANGTKDSSDYGMNDWQMTLFPDAGCSGNSIDQKTTAGLETIPGVGNVQAGNLVFTDLIPGQYSVRETLWAPDTVFGDEWINTTGGVCQDITVEPGTEANISFGNYRQGGITMCKYNDLNGNGNNDSGEPPISGWTMYVYTPDQQTLTGITGGNGCVRFSNLPYGQYRIYEENRTGWIQTFPSTIDRNVNLSSRISIGVQFRNFQLGSISGQKFNDINSNGVKDINEPGIQGWTIELDKDADDSINDTTTTDSNGNYIFEDLEYGTYRVREQGQTGWTQTTTNPSDIPIQSGTFTTGIDFGNFENTDVKVCKKDTEGNVIPEWKVYLNGDEKLTGENGCVIYTITEAGEYTVTEENRTGWTAIEDTSFEFFATSGGEYGPYTFVNFEDVDLEVCKIDTEGNPVLRWAVTLDEDTQITGEDGCYTWTVTTPRTYIATEEDREGWTPQSAITHDFVVTSGMEPQSYTFINFEDVDLEVCKIDTEGNPVLRWAVTLDEDTQITGEDGCYTWTVTEPRTYTASEENRDGWTPQGEITHDFVVTSGMEPQSYTFINFEDASALVCKVDANANPVLGWTIYFADEEELTDEEGCTSFTITEPGDYTVSEGSRLGWTPLSDTSETFTAISGYTHEITFANYVIQPELLLTKSNDSDPLGLLAGETVIYTLEVTAPKRDGESTDQYIVNDVKVIDLLPAGFSYILGTWTATSSLVGDLTLLEPIYTNGNPATWFLGNMVEGEVITLTYQALISSTQDAGLYKDLAWTEGNSLLGSRVLGNFDTGVFVDTQVLVIQPEIFETGSVLGARTVIEEKVLGATTILLAQTGANILLILGALISMLIGFVLLTMQPAKRKLILIALAILSVFAIYTGIKSNEVYATTTNLTVRIAEPKTPTDKTSFNVGFVTLDLEGNDVTVQCKETTYGIFDTYTLPSGGGSGQCVVDETVLTASGDYEFQVIASTTTETITSDKVTVKVNFETPSPVEEYEKTKQDCKYILTFTVPNEEYISKVQIFRSTTTPFTANTDTKIAEMSVTPNQKVTYTDTLLDCQKDFYYAVRTLNNVSNTSTLVTDKIIEVEKVQIPGQTIVQIVEPETTTQATTTAVTTQTPVTEEVDEEDDEAIVDDEGEILGTTLTLPTCEKKILLSGYVLLKEEGVEGISIDIYYIDPNGGELKVNTVKTNSEGYWDIELCEGKYYTKIVDLAEEYLVDGDEKLEISLSEDENTLTYNLKTPEKSFWSIILPWILGIVVVGIPVVYLFSRKKY